MPVYFIRAGEDGPVKIGWAADVQGRMRELQTGNVATFVLLREFDGRKAEEAEFHRHYKALRIRGEWFEFCASMLTIEPGDIPPLPDRPARRGRVFPQTALRCYLREEGETFASFGERIGISAQAVHRYAVGERVPRPKIMRAIIEATGGRVTYAGIALPEVVQEQAWDEVHELLASSITARLSARAATETILEAS